MKIGILTLHDSLNYGALAQAFALGAYLRREGHDAAVIDRRRDAECRLPRPTPRFAQSVRLFGMFALDARNFEREISERTERTLNFLKNKAILTPFHFHAWKDAPKDLGFDLVIIGSDQVWNANNLNPRDYLMIDAPNAPAAIAYAASFGMSRLPENLLDDFRAGFSILSAIGVREKEGVGMIEALGFKSCQVVDPVLLAGREVWESVVNRGESESGRGESAASGTDGGRGESAASGTDGGRGRGESAASGADGGRGERGKVFAYFLGEDYPALFEPLGAFARERGTRVDFFAEYFTLGETRGWRAARRNARKRRRWSEAGVDLRMDAGPEEFVRAIAESSVVVSNSYHALMFALLFGKEVRIVLPTLPIRRKMNSRLKEFEGAVVTGPLIHDSLASALASLRAGERCALNAAELSRRVAFSREWLAAAIENAKTK